MKRMVIAHSIALAAAMTCFASTIYVKPTASGTGDGSSWANAMGDVREAVIATFSDSAAGVIKLSKGVHKWSEMLYVGRDSSYGHHAFTIQGGFAGESEDETADNAANPTYLSFDANGDDRWVKRSLSSLATTGTSTTTDCGLIVDGDSVTWPDDTDDDDALYSPDASKVSDNVKFLKLNDNNAIVTLCDFTLLGAGTGAPFIDTTGAWGCKFKNLNFLGSYVKGAMINFSRPAGDTVCENVKMLWTHLGATTAPWGVGGQANRVFKGFDIKGVYAGVTMNGGGLFFCGGDNMGSGCVFKDSTFEKCYGSQSAGYKAQAIVFGLEKATSGLTITNCTFRRICSRGNAVASVLSARSGDVTGLPRMRIVDCLFEGNESYATASSGELNNFGIVVLAAEACSLEGCTFRNNTVTVKPTGSATAARAGVVTLTSPIHVNATTSPHRLLVNCTFAGNTIAVADGSNDATATPRDLSRSVMVSSLASDKALDVVLAHCTFAGSASAEPDVVWTGLETTSKVRVLNSIFNGSAEAGYVPLAASALGVLTVENSLLNGCASLPSGITGTDNVFGELPMGDWDDLSGIRLAPVLRPAARFPALRSAATLGRFQKDNATYLTDVSGAHVYNDASSIVIPATVDPLLDAVGEAHPEGASTIGAVQTLTAAAENGATLHLSSSPAGAGTLSGGGSIQVVEKGAGVVSVTATSSDPSKYTFVGWQNPDGTVYSTEAELTISALDADLQLTAVFSAPQTTYTFDLGGAGTFEENGQSTIVKKLDAGSTLTVPAFTIDEEHYQPVGWDVTPPQTVGTSDQTFTYNTIAKIHRILRVDLNLSEGGDGSTWALAMTNIQEAIDTAAQWTGEVWIRQGVHRFAKAQTDKLTMAKNVEILGGFEGEDGKYATVDAERAARDPKLYPSVISADIAGDDPWSKNGSATASQKVVVDGKIAYPEFEPGHNYYGVSIYYPNANYVFDNSAATLDETAVLDGVTLVSAITKNLYNGDTARPAVRNCTFVGSGVESKTYLTISNCTFLAISGVVAVQFAGGTATGAHGTVRDCTFRYCNNGTAGKGVFTFSTQNGFFEIRDSLFEQCTGSIGLNYYQATVIGTEWGSGLISGTIVRNCWTEQGVLMMTPAAGCIVTNCLFEGNSCVQNKSGAATSTGNIPYVMMRNGQPSASASYYNTTFRNNSVTRTVGDNANSKDGNAAILQSTGKLLLVNCTFDGNTVTCTSPLADYPATSSVLLAPGSAYCGVVHSTFNDNVAADGDVAFIGRTGTAASYIVNSILAGGEGHVPVSGTGNAAQVLLWNSIAQNLDESSEILVESVGNSTADPQISQKWVGSEPVVARRVSGGSPAVRLGLNVYLDNGVVCIPTDADETAFVNAATGAAVTPSDDKTMLADVFGAARTANKVTAGAMQVIASGFKLIIR